MASLRTAAEAVRHQATSFSTKVTEVAKEHTTALNAARTRYREAFDRSKGHQASVQEIDRLTQTISQRDARIQVLDNELGKLAGAQEAFDQARAAWREVIERRGALTKQRCEQVSADSSGDVRGVFRPCADARKSIELLAEVARGARLKSEKLESLATTIAESLRAFEDWERFIDEVRSLIGIRSDEAELPHCPSLRAVGMTDKELRGLATKLDEETWLRLRLAAPGDVVEFQYRTREGNYIAFHVASAGQRATALMRLLLAQGGGPLVIDQPEDDLDNRVIHQIAESLSKAKEKRQLIFASHNANLVVNGDADLIAVFNYRVAGEQTAGEIAREGAIDDSSVCDWVTTIMEGGKDAFVLRRHKYGY